MGAPSAQSIAKRILQLDASIIEIDKATEEVLNAACGQLSEFERAELHERLYPSVVQSIGTLLQTQQEQGLIPRFYFSGQDGNRLLKAGFRPEDKEEGRIVAHREAVVRALSKVEWRDFEFLAKYLLQMNGISDAQVGRGHREGGIDFYGFLDLASSSRGTLLRRLRVRILGQAKHWKAKVSKDDMDVFIKHYEDLAAGKGPALKVLPAGFAKDPSPVLAVYLTLTGYEAGAKASAKERGVVTWTAEAVAEELLRGHPSAWVAILNGKEEFDEKGFLDFVKSLRV